MDTIVGIEIFPLISLVIFFGFFIGLLVYVTRLSKPYIETVGALPLDDESTASTSQNPMP